NQMLFAPVFMLLGWAMIILSGIMLLPALFALAPPEGNLLYSFCMPAAITLFLGGGLVLAMRSGMNSLGRRETFLAATLIWTVVPAFAAIPFYVSGTISLPLDAYFEALSGFTTNGATTITDLDNLPRGILFWRSILQWSGGFALIVFLSILATTFSLPVNNPLARAIAKSRRRRVSRRGAAGILSLFQVYVVLTLLCIIALWAVGMSAFDSLCYAFSTVSTGGFTTSNIAGTAFANRAIEVVLMIFMVLGAVNFSLHWSFFNGDRKSYFRDPEYRYLLLAIAIGSVLLFWLMMTETDMGAAQTFRYAIFNAVSAITTTGYNLPLVSSSGGYYWPIGALLLVLVMITLGGSTGSTAGGIKLMRFSLLMKLSNTEVKRLSFPSSVFPLTYDGVRVLPEQILSAWSFFVLYCFAIALVTLLLAWNGLDFQSSLSLAVTNLANAGSAAQQLITEVQDGNRNFIDYHQLSSASKWILSIAMLAGRLEFFALLSLLNPALWRR
ncbi:MAG: TrkH family potassium uptake protein, partial [Alphaproteobacteria bacterium]